MKYYSQYDQDKFIDRIIFNGKKRGYFVDIGAYDGKTISNTYFFEKQRMWEGLCFEPNPSAFLLLKKNRSCSLYNCCIGSSKKNSIFFQVIGNSEMLSGLKSAYDPRHLERIQRETKENMGFVKEIEVQIKSLNDFLAFGQVVDFITIDTEGNEFEILQSIDFQRIEIKSISVENNYRNPEIQEFLYNLDYILVVRLKCDEIYVKRRLIDFPMKLRILYWKFLNRLKLHKNGFQKRLKIK